MKITTKTKLQRTTKLYLPNLSRTVEWFGGVNFENLEKVTESIKSLMVKDSTEIQLLINSYGGPTGVGMSFYDTMKIWLGDKLTTVGSGYVDSSGILVFLAGEKRFLTKNTTMLLHLAGRKFEAEKRFTTRDMEDMLREDKLKDYQYASVVSDATGNRYFPEKILDMMANNTVLTAEEAVNMGLAHKVI